MTVRLGIIAEDDGDVDVAEILIRKIAAKHFQVKKFVGRGCGKIVAKCRPWATTLHSQGCSLLIIIHDLDEKSEPVLRQMLNNALNPSPIAKHVIIIPIKELEAWLLSDHDAINLALKLKRPLPKVSNPQALARPKERLRDLIYSYSQKRIIYVNTIHNARIAAKTSIRVIKARCSSFVPFANFVSAYLG